MKEELTEKVPEAVIRRLPKYYRYLEELCRMEEVRVSSSKMSRDLGLNASQIRRDLNCFGGFGQQGYGYSVAKLKGEIARILGLDKTYQMIVVGAGNIGQALVRYTKFSQKGYHPVGMFDVSPALVGTQVGDVLIRHTDELLDFMQGRQVEIGIICTPKSAAQKTADLLARAGVRGIWNFAPVDVQVEQGVAVENVHLNDGLYVLTYRFNAKDASSREQGIQNI